MHRRAAEDEIGLSDGSVDGADDEWLAEVLLSHVASIPLPLPFPLPALVRAAAVPRLAVEGTQHSHPNAYHSPSDLPLPCGRGASLSIRASVAFHMIFNHPASSSLPGFRVVFRFPTPWEEHFGLVA